MTVVLFGSIFAWVTTFPVPTQPNATQFSANLVLTTNLSYVKAIQITHLAGPSVSGNALIYLKSAYHPSAPEFQNPIAASVGIPNPSSWNLGQTFNYTFPCPAGACEQPKLPDNITVLVVASSQVIFSTILPGTVISVPPNFVVTSVSPATPSVGASFTITAVVSGNVGTSNVYVNVSNIPGLKSAYPTAQVMTYTASTNRWTFTVPAYETNANGTYYAFVNVTNGVGQTAVAGVVVTISGASSVSSGLTVAVVMIPQPPTLPTTSAYFAALVTYQGTGTNLGLTVGFWANQTPGTNGPKAWPGSSQALSGPSGLTISGPSTETVYSSSPATYSSWLLNSSVSIAAAGTVSTVGSASGSTNFATLNLVTGSASWSTSPTKPSHTCSGSSCPYLTATVKNAWLTSMSPAGTSITFAGIMYANQTGHTFSSAIASTALASGAATTSSTVDSAARWTPSIAGAFTLVLVLTVTLTSSGATIGYIWATVSGTST